MVLTGKLFIKRPLPPLLLFLLLSLSASSAVDGRTLKSDTLASTSVFGEAEEYGIDAEPSATVETTYGSVRGFDNGDSYAFLGIPYAASPEGDLRFKPAVEPSAWDGVLNATQFSPGCPQRCPLHLDLVCPNESSEDCLYLNVYVPKGNPPSAEGWPVFVWIHGGGFQIGAGGTKLYGGNAFTTENVILVTLNYRLGALGWLVVSEEEGNGGEIDAESIINGNFGLSDQRLALKWVRDNIGNFGGNENKVTLGGESAGAMSVLVHMVSPASEGLFDRAVIESGTIALPYNQPNGTNSYFKKLLSKAGCSVDNGGESGARRNSTLVDCLRALPVESFLDAQDDMMNNLLDADALKQPADLLQPFYPAIYTEDVPMHPLDAFEKGNFARVPTIIGNNHDEGVLFVNFIFGDNEMLPMPVPLETMYPAILAAFFGFSESQAIKDQYSNETSALDALAAMVTDYMFSASTRKVASSLEEHGVPVSTYVFSYTPQTLIPDLAGNLGPVMDLIKYCEDKACHGEEIPFVFNAFETIGAYDEQDMEVVHKVVDLWTDFIKSEENINQWPTYTSEKKQWLNIGKNLTIIDHFNEDKLNFWDREVGFDYWPQRV